MEVFEIDKLTHLYLPESCRDRLEELVCPEFSQRSYADKAPVRVDTEEETKCV